MNENTPVKLVVTIQPADESTPATEVVSATMYAGYARDAVLYALDSVSSSVQAAVLRELEMQAADEITARQQPILDASEAAATAFNNLIT